MVMRRSGLLVFEDIACGSFAAQARIPAAGFRWEPSEGGRPGNREGHRHLNDRGPWLVENDSWGNDEPWGYRYPPFQKGNELARLSVEFALLSTPGQYLSFANQYGRLGRWRERESLALWQHHTRDVRILTTLMTWIKRKDREKLGWVVRWATDPDRPILWPGAVLDWWEARERGQPYETVPDNVTAVTRSVRQVGGELQEVSVDVPWFWRIGKRIIGASDVLHDYEGHPRWTTGDLIEPAKFYVIDQLNRAVAGHVTTKLLPFAPAELWRLYVVPDCLLAVIYTQLQIMFTRGGIDHDCKPCEADGCLNFVRPTGNTRYCSEPCKRWGRSQANRRHHQSRLDKVSAFGNT